MGKGLISHVHCCFSGSRGCLPLPLKYWRCPVLTEALPLSLCIPGIHRTRLCSEGTTDIFVPPTNTMRDLLCEILLSVPYFTDGKTEAESYPVE